jgi:hypothetical protein
LLKWQTLLQSNVTHFYCPSFIDTLQNCNCNTARQLAFTTFFLGMPDVSCAPTFKKQGGLQVWRAGWWPMLWTTTTNPSATEAITKACSHCTAKVLQHVESINTAAFSEVYRNFTQFHVSGPSKITQPISWLKNTTPHIIDVDKTDNVHITEH